MVVHQFSPSVSASCSCGASVCGGLVPVSRYAFQRRVRRRYYSWSPSVGCRVYSLACGCFLWVYASGQRFVSSLPF